jgi:hypothetical protein
VTKLKSVKSEKVGLVLVKRSQNKKPRHPSNFHDNLAPGDVAFQNSRTRISNGSDPHQSDADKDSTYHPDADSDFYLMRMRILMRIRLSTLMRIRIRIRLFT